MRIAIASDDGGFGLEAELVNRLAAGNDPDYVLPRARAVIGGQVEHGIAICASGAGAQGMRE